MWKKGGAAIVGLTLMAGQTVAQLQDWAVGEERELDPGYYTKVLANEDGWVTFQIESGEGQRCQTVKGQPGRPVHEPIRGLSVYMADHYVLLGGGKLAPGVSGWRIAGKHTGEAEWRISGERFMQKLPDVETRLDPDGQMIEFRYEAWEYPRAHIGYYVREGRFDMTGLRAAIKRHKKLCGAV